MLPKPPLTPLNGPLWSGEGRGAGSGEGSQIGGRWEEGGGRREVKRVKQSN